VKTLEYDEVIEIGTASDAQLGDGAALLNTLRSNSGDNLRRRVRDGHMQANTININETPAYVVFWRKLEPDCLDVMGATKLGPGRADFKALMEGCADIATANGCSYAVFHSNRRGMCATVLKHGGRVHSVCYTMLNHKFKGDAA
jgi:hypothetical protein